MGLEHVDLKKTEDGIPTAALESQSEKLMDKGLASSLPQYYGGKVQIFMKAT